MHLSESKAQGQSPTIILKTCLGTPPKDHAHRPSTPRIPERTSYSEHLASEDRASNVIIQTLKFEHLPKKTSQKSSRPVDPNMESKEFQCNFKKISLHHRHGGEILSFTRKYSWLFFQTCKKSKEQVE